MAGLYRVGDRDIRSDASIHYQDNSLHGRLPERQRRPNVSVVGMDGDWLRGSFLDARLDPLPMDGTISALYLHSTVALLHYRHQRTRLSTYRALPASVRHKVFYVPVSA